MHMIIKPIEKPMPLSRNGVAHQRLGRVYRDATLIFIKNCVVDEILDYSARDMRCETGGFLVGGYFVDGEQSYIEIRHFAPAFDAHSQAGSLTFTHETWAKASDDIRTRFPGERMLGWHHTHPGLGLFFSEYDQFIHRNFFSEPWQVAMVVDPRSREFVFYQWRNDELVDCGIVVVKSEQ